MTTQLQTIGGFSPDEIQVMQQTLAVGTTPAQFNLFVRTAAASGLNPFLNHFYCIVYSGKMSIQVSVEGIVFLAKRVEGYQGIDTQLVHENDEFEAYMDKDGKWVIGEHRIKFPRGKVIAGYSVAYRENFKPFTVFMEVDEVQHNLSGNNAALWKKYFNDMFKKHMTKRSAKGQFGIEIAEDDTPAVGSIDNVPPYESPKRKDITTEVEQAAAEKEQEIQQKEDDEATKKDEARKQLEDKFQMLGITDKDEVSAYIKKNAKPKGTKLTLSEMLGLLKIMDMHIAEKQDQAASADELT
ncbi:RecT family recombinase [Brevibacillus reuszeri]|uniref:RecT family recombinase n=1 Tax=Brevibacillus reuszeri TaxID=54915 RepID=UPI003D1CFA4C